MRQQVVVITPPEASPVTLAQAKAQCGATSFTDDDDLLQLFIDTATQWIDGPAGWLGRCLNPQTLELRRRLFTRSGELERAYFDGDMIRPGHDPWSPRIELPYGPALSIISVNYLDMNGAPQTVDPSLYVQDGDAVLPAFDQIWPEVRGDPSGVRVQYAAGYLMGAGDPPVTGVPAPIRQAILLLVSHFYNHRDAVVGVENRDSSTEMPLGVESLLGPYRVLD